MHSLSGSHRWKRRRRPGLGLLRVQFARTSEEEAFAGRRRGRQHGVGRRGRPRGWGRGGGGGVFPVVVFNGFIFTKGFVKLRASLRDPCELSGTTLLAQEENCRLVGDVLGCGPTVSKAGVAEESSG